jgi:hypothetical protein
MLIADFRLSITGWFETLTIQQYRGSVEYSPRQQAARSDQQSAAL